MTRQERIVEASKQYGGDNEEIRCHFIDGCHWADDNPDLYSVVRKAVARERKYIIDKACRFIYNLATHLHSTEAVESFKKYMEE